MQIAAAIGGAVSPATVSRRMREVRGSVKTPRGRSSAASTGAPPTTDAAPLPASPAEVPEGATLPELQSLLTRCKVALTNAEASENLPLVGQMIRVAAQISETIRKATPVKQVDPNDGPDMVALRVEAARKWHEMVDLVADGDP